MKPNKKTYGEELFEKYLKSQNIDFVHEPRLSYTDKLIDYVLSHKDAGQILLEVKDIHNPLPLHGASAFDPYGPIRSHITKGTAKFKGLPDSICCLVLVAAEGSFVDLQSPHVMLGAMYGDLGFTIPFNPQLGHHDASQLSSGFQPGRGKMLHATGPQNKRIAALISLHNYDTLTHEIRHYWDTDDGRSREKRMNDTFEGRVAFDSEKVPCVTVWENGLSNKKLPQDLFRGAMDAWWTAESGEQKLSFIGDRRKRLKVDERMR